VRPFVVLLVGVGLVPARARAEPERLGQLDAVVAVPSGALGERVRNPGAGLSMVMGIWLPGLPLAVGAELGFLRYGWRFERPVGHGDVERMTDVLSAHLLWRLQPRGGPVRPYLETLLGLRSFIASTSIEDDRGDERWSEEGGDAAFSCGVGAGLAVRFGDAHHSDGRVTPAFLAVGVRWLRGGVASYLRLGDGGAPFVAERSRTDLWLFTLGIGG
jgi:hypothetical protein